MYPRAISFFKYSESFHYYRLIFHLSAGMFPQMFQIRSMSQDR